MQDYNNENGNKVDKDGSNDLEDWQKDLVHRTFKEMQEALAAKGARGAFVVAAFLMDDSDDSIVRCVAESTGDKALISNSLAKLSLHYINQVEDEGRGVVEEKFND